MKVPLKLEVENVNSKHLVLAVKDENDDNQDDVKSLGADSAERDDNASDSEKRKMFRIKVIWLMKMILKILQKVNINFHQFVQVKDWISTYHLDRLEVTDVLSNYPSAGFPIKYILEKLVKEGILSSAGTDTYIIKTQKKSDYEFDVVKEESEGQQNQKGNQSQHGKVEDYMYMKALFHALPMNYVTVAKLQSKLKGEANQSAMKRLIDKMTQDGFIEAKCYRRLGKHVIHSDLTVQKLAEVTKVLAKDSMDIDIHESEKNFRDLSTCGALHSVGLDLTRTRGKSDAYRNRFVMSDQIVSKRKEHEKTPSSNAELVASRESFVPGEENRRVNRKPNQPDEYEIMCSRSSRDKRQRKASMVKEPILQYVRPKISSCLMVPQL